MRTCEKHVEREILGYVGNMSANHSKRRETGLFKSCRYGVRGKRVLVLMPLVLPRVEVMQVAQVRQVKRSGNGGRQRLKVSQC